ncbi:hypothetical protein KA344_18430 [bacterium]|jgi:hypothetical protein|nr:hypothetical protein [bacterium]
MAVGKKGAKTAKPSKGSMGAGSKKPDPNKAVFDATPEEDGADISHDGKSALKPHDIRDTKAYLKAQNGAKRMWSNYVAFLGSSFQRMERDEQIATIQKFSMVFSIGIAALAISCFYSMLPQPIRVIAVPIAIGGAWWFGTKVIAPQLVNRLDKYIHPDED